MTIRRVLAIALLFAGCGCGSDSSAGSADAAGQSADALASSETFSVEFTTTAGNFMVDVTRAWSTTGADRFRELVEAGFYDECRFFRVIPGFVVQFGINGDPTIQAMWTGNTIADDSVVESNLRGTVTFAKTSAPNSRTTQLFINYGDNSNLDAMGFSPFGVVRTGIENVDTINSEYGESPDQGQITSQGNSYLDANFPNLDSITTARIVP